MRSLPLVATIVVTLALAGCGGTPATPAERLEEQARDYVRLALALGARGEREVDAYFGPEDLRPAPGKAPPPQDIAGRAQALVGAIDADYALDPRPRRAQLREAALGLAAAADAVGRAKPLPFDEEAQRVYGMQLVPLDLRERAKALRAELDALLPGIGTLPFRVAKFRSTSVVPADRRAVVFERALAECRARTIAHWSLPPDERLDVQWTRDVDAAWHRYHGGHRSTLQVNPAAVAYVGAMVDVACHEGYPGHHAQFLLREAGAPLPVERTVSLLRSPQSVLREGAAHYAVELAFPPAERAAFERDVLFPLAGLPAAEAGRHSRVQQLQDELAFLTLQMLRDYRDGVVSFNSSTFNLEGEALVTSPKALLQFVDAWGAYVTGYTVAPDRVREAVARKAGEGGDAWAALREMLAGEDVSAIAAPTAAEITARAAPPAQDERR